MFGNDSGPMDAGEHNIQASSVREYAYEEDRNTRFRPGMEDSKFTDSLTLQPTASSTKWEATRLAEFSLFSMVMAEGRSPITWPRGSQLR